MFDEFASTNVVLSLAAGALIGLWWTLKTKRPRAWWSILGTFIILVLSQHWIQDVCLVCVDSTGVYARLLLTAMTAVILIGVAVRKLVRQRTVFSRSQ